MGESNVLSNQGAAGVSIVHFPDDEEALTQRLRERERLRRGIKTGWRMTKEKKEVKFKPICTLIEGLNNVQKLGSFLLRNTTLVFSLHAREKNPCFGQ